MAAGPKPGAWRWVDQFWRLFASIRLAIVLIFLIAVASIFGSLIPQEGAYPSTLPPEIYYPLEHGAFGEWMHRLGFTRMYSSWWFVSLLIAMGVNLTVCSLERVAPLVRSLRRPKVKRSDRFIASRPVHRAFEIRRGGGDGGPLEAEVLDGFESHLRSRRFHCERSGNHIYADKGRWGRYGPYVTHIGLMFLLAAALSMSIPGWHQDEFFWLEDGETKRIPGTDMFVRSEGFHVEFYEDGRPKHFQTDVVLIDEGRELPMRSIRVNHPVSHKRVSLFQSSYELTLGSAVFPMFDLSAGPGGRFVGLLEIDMRDPQEAYVVGDHTVRLINYFPDFYVDPAQGPMSRSGDPLNPAFVLEIEGPQREPVLHWLFVGQPDFVPPGLDSPYRFQIESIQIARRSGLTAHKNLALPFIYFGMIVTVVGIALSFYIYHRRIWASVSGGRLLVGAMCNKHLTSLRREMEGIFAAAAEAAQGPSAPSGWETQPPKERTAAAGERL